MVVAYNNIMQSGLQGYQSASNQINQAASELANGARRPIDINGAAVSLQQASLQAQASAEVIKRADGMVGTIIDIFV